MKMLSNFLIDKMEKEGMEQFMNSKTDLTI